MPKATDTKRTAVQPSHIYGEWLHTRQQWRLARKADRLLAAAGFFDQPEAGQDALEHILEDMFGEADYEPVPAECIATYGGLKPNWHGSV